MKIKAFFVILFLLESVIMIHELGHALVFSAFGVSIDTVAIGLSLPPKLQFALGDTEVIITPWCIGGGVTPDAVEFEALPVGKKICAIFAGPLCSLLFGAVLLCCIYGVKKGIANLGEFIVAMVKTIFDMVKHKKNNFSSFKDIFATGIDSVLSRNAMMFVALISISLAVANLLPLYPLDGGKIIDSLIVAVLPSTTLVKNILDDIRLLMMFIVIGLLLYPNVRGLLNSEK